MVSVQPMTQPKSTLFYMDAIYGKREKSAVDQLAELNDLDVTEDNDLLEFRRLARIEGVRPEQIDRIEKLMLGVRCRGGKTSLITSQLIYELTHLETSVVDALAAVVDG